MPEMTIGLFKGRAVGASIPIARGLLVLCAIATAACTIDLGSKGPEQTDPAAFAWNQPVDAGKTIKIRNLNGSVEVRPATDGNVKVTASVKWHKGDPKKDLIFATSTFADGPMICAIWGTGSCNNDGYNSKTKWGSSKTDAEVAFIVWAPTGVRIDAFTANGSVSVTATAPVKAQTINGGIKVATSVGPVDAETVNGSVDIRMTTLGPDGPVRAHTVNGSATAYLPEKFDGRVALSATLGEVTSDFASADLQKSSKSLTETLGTGGRLVDLGTITGSAALHKLNAKGEVVAP